MGVMSKHIDSAPAAKKVVPSGPDWLHEVKHHGYRAVAWSATARARVCFPRPAWTGPGAPRGSSKRPQIRLNRFIIDGEICVLDVQGISDFYTLHSGRHDDEARLYAFDIMVMNGDDLRELPLFERKEKLAQLARGRPEGSL